MSAILSTITVKLHADTVRSLLAKKIDETDAPKEEKSLIKRQLANLPEVALKSATEQLLQVGLEHVPNTIEWLRLICGL